MSIIRTITAAALALAAGTAGAETLRFSSFEPPVAHITKNILTPWAEEVSAASNGAIDIQMFAGGTLGRSPAQQLKLVEDGVADFAWIIPGYSPGRFTQGTVAELPFMVPNATVGSEAMWKMVEDGYFTGDYDKFKLIGVLVSAPNFIVSRIPIVEPEDMKGINFRGPGPVMLKAVEALGAVPVGGITGPTIADAIRRGLVEGTMTQWAAVETFRIGEVTDYYMTAPLGATPMLVLMNKAKYDSLPDEAKAAIDKFSGAAFSERFGKSFDAHHDAAGDREAATGATIVKPDAALTQRWKDATQVAVDDWIATTENGQAIYDAFRERLDAAAAAH